MLPIDKMLSQLRAHLVKFRLRALFVHLHMIPFLGRSGSLFGQRFSRTRKTILICAVSITEKHHADIKVPYFRERYQQYLLVPREIKPKMQLGRAQRTQCSRPLLLICLDSSLILLHNWNVTRQFWRLWNATFLALQKHNICYHLGEPSLCFYIWIKHFW